MDNIIFQSGAWKVTDKVLETPRAAHDLEAIQSISARRTLLPILGAPAIGLLLFTLSFLKYLFAGEIVFTLILCAGLLILALRFGSIRVNSIAHANDSELATAYGDYELLKQVKAAALHVKSGSQTPFQYDADAVHDPLKKVATLNISDAVKKSKPLIQNLKTEPITPSTKDTKQLDKSSEIDSSKIVSSHDAANHINQWSTKWLNSYATIKILIANFLFVILLIVVLNKSGINPLWLWAISFGTALFTFFRFVPNKTAKGNIGRVFLSIIIAPICVFFVVLIFF